MQIQQNNYNKYCKLFIDLRNMYFEFEKETDFPLNQLKSIIYKLDSYIKKYDMSIGIKSDGGRGNYNKATKCQ